MQDESSKARTALPSALSFPGLKAEACRANPVRATASAFNGARELGINDLAGMCDVVLLLKSTDFYKSMTTHADHRVWQDVYRTKTARGDEVYLKLTVIDEVLIVSFKEL